MQRWRGLMGTETGSNSDKGHEPIAIIGIGCRFPGAPGPEEFWRLLMEGRDTVGEVPRERFDIDAFYDPNPATPGKIVTRAGGFLENIDQFAASFFGISPREAGQMDPQQRLLLEVAWEALEDAGQVPERLEGSPTGVFAGLLYTDYQDQLMANRTAIDVYGNVGVSASVLSGRLSYALNLRGPSLTLDTACSSSLVALHLACQSLRNGETTLCLAAGANIILEPDWSIGFSQAKMLAPDGRCKFGDARADGFVRSEGVAVVVLKPLSLAQADGDPIYALIRGSAVNNDGRSSGYLMTPGVEGQALVLAEAYRDAGVSPARVAYVEAHGTGTGAGDPVELEALASVLGPNRPADRPFLVGSVKTNIGHTEGASGLAGLIKVALSLKHGVIPKSLHFETPNPNIPWKQLPLLLPSEVGPWPSDGTPAIAGVSSFGIAGTNAHVVVEEAPRPAGAPDTATSPSAQLLPLSADGPEALADLARSYVSFLNTAGNSVRDICFTAAVRRTHHPQRLALVGQSPADLTEKLEAFLQEEGRAGMVSGRVVPDREHKVVFVFPGQGSQWLGMGRRLMEEEPVFREQLEACDAAIRQFTDWSLLEELGEARPGSRLENDINVIQPALFAVEIALAALWRSWGIEPDAVVGHSMGEVAAACVAGALTLEDAAKVICLRSQLLRRISGQGAMAVVDLSLRDAEQTITGRENLISVAVSNSASSTVLSGDTDTLKSIMERLERDGIFCRLVKVDVASHSPQVDCLRDDLLEALREVHPLPASIPMMSTVRSSVAAGIELDASYWAHNLRDPVLFAGAIERLIDSGHDIFLEMSPNPLLVGAVQQTARHVGREISAFPSLRREEEERPLLLESLANLYALGYPIRWDGVFAAGGTCVELPMYPWQREAFWLQSGQKGDLSHRVRRGDHPLLGDMINVASTPNVQIWETAVDLDASRYLRDHRVRGSVVLPAATIVEMVLEAPLFVEGGDAVLDHITIHNAMILSEDEVRAIQLVITADVSTLATVEIYSRRVGTPAEEWILHASGEIRNDPTRPSPDAGHADLAGEMLESRGKEDHYAVMEAHGLRYGPLFQGVSSVRRLLDWAEGTVTVPPELANQVADYRFHPAVLDACIQVCLGEVLSAAEHANPGAAERSMTYVPVALRGVRVHRPATDETLLVRTRVQSPPHAAADTIEADLVVRDQRGEILIEAAAITFQRIEAGSGTMHDDWLYDLAWEEDDNYRTTGAGNTPHGSWLILADSGGIGDRVAALLQARGEHCVVVRAGTDYHPAGAERGEVNPARAEHFDWLVHDSFIEASRPCRGVIHLWSLDARWTREPELAAIEAAQDSGVISGLHLIQALTHLKEAPKLCFVTRAACRVLPSDTEVSVAQAPLKGLVRTAANEHPELRCSSIDLSAEPLDIDLQNLAREACDGETGGDVALRDGERWVLRLIRHGSSSPSGLKSEAYRRRTLRGDEPFLLRSTEPGILDHLALQETARRQPERGEVEIKVSHAGLNFRDVMSALGLLTGYPDGVGPLGHECAGTITAIGDGVQSFQIGDEVVALGHDAFGSYLTTDARLVALKPTPLTAQEAATLPITFLTASYALEHVARLTAGERVLIHAAAGGVGLAAVQLAQAIGAEVFATAGSPEKRDLLRSLGIRHVMDSRTLAFADEVKEITAGKGVDVVLNSLAGEFIPRSLSTLGPYGRFVEIGRRDIYENSRLGLLPFQNNLSFSAIDLDRMFVERPALVGSILHDLMQRAERGEIRPLPSVSFPISDIVGAFRHMAQARHIGKIVVSLDVPEVEVNAPLTIRPDATYLITGGVGGLGLVTAQWLVRQGARHLVLVSRRGAGMDAEPVLESLREGGANLVIARVDISQEEQIAALFADIHRSLPPLRGIVHAAGILDDGTLAQQSRERFNAVMAPKISGAWSLHKQTRRMDLDFFVLFSSAAALVGSPGQGNYVAANVFLDSLAEYRQSHGLPALSINWGPWSEVGLAAKPERGDRLALRGMGSITPDQGAEVLERVLEENVSQIGVMPMDWQQWRESYPVSASSPLLASLASVSTGPLPADGQLTELTAATLLALPLLERESTLEAYVTGQITGILRLASERLDRHQPLVRLGLDSLMAVELRARIERGLGVSVPVTKLLQDFSTSQLARHVLSQMHDDATGQDEPLVAVHQSGATANITREPAGGVLDHLDGLSDDDVSTLLTRLMAQAEGRE